jgi:hypothetical protein
MGSPMFRILISLVTCPKVQGVSVDVLEMCPNVLATPQTFLKLGEILVVNISGVVFLFLL